MKDWLNQPTTNKVQDIQLGVPISYRVNYLSDNQIAKLSFTMSYHHVDTSPIPQLTSWVITFHTEDDDKDADTGLLVEVIAGGTVVAHYAGNGEKFANGSSIPKQLDQDRVLFYRDAQQVQLHVRIDPNGHDTWDFSYTLTAKNSGGGPNYYKAGHMRLTQDHREKTE
jgi:hypothetical protein